MTRRSLDKEAGPRPKSEDGVSFSIDVVNRFWEKVDLRDHKQCWEWLGGKLRKGYGRFSVNGRLVQAHRFSWMLDRRRLLKSSTHVLHKCDNPSCVNPRHLFSGSNSKNVQDAVSKGTHKAGEPKIGRWFIKQFKKMYEDGKSTTEIATHFDFSETTVRKYTVQGKS